MTTTLHSKATSLEAAQLYTYCDPAHLDFTTTAELEDLPGIIGQGRAAEAIRFGVSLRRDGYHVYVLGPAGSGRYSLVARELKGRAAAEPSPDDWCYVNNFEAPHKPTAIRLPPGRGEQLQHHMRQFVEELRSVIPAAFESEEYHSRLEAMNEDFKRRQEEAVEEIGKAAREKGIALIQTPTGFALAPMKGDEVITPDEFDALPDEEKQRFQAEIQKLDEQLHKAVHHFPGWRREHHAKIRDYNRETVATAVGHLIEELRAHYEDLPEVIAYLEATQADLIANAAELREPATGEGMEGVATVNPLQRYQVNLMAKDGTAEGAPVITEDHPTYQNLIGRIEHISHMGTLVTNYTLIKPGALHRANGGYLILDAGKVLTQPYAWEGLKRALQTRHIRIESVGEYFGLVSTLSLQPQPIPMDVKLVLYGERMFYYLLHQLDPDFPDLFKIAADFEDEVARNPENSKLYARMIAALVRKNNLRPFGRDAVARLIEHAARLAEDASRLSTHMRSLNDLLVESEHFARGANRDTVGAADVQMAIDGQIHRASRLHEHRLRQILEGTMLIATDGMHAGQVNGLAATILGSHVFAGPTRITATTRLGEGNVVDIEREVDLGGAIHSKGVLILSSFLAARYSHSTPLSLNASLVFEQSYGSVEGDSASMAELCALLSALSGLPINQGLALTGSVNQYGQAQPIGAVNEKIEGFFDVCKARRLTGSQGVLIPASNVKHLMLRRDVVEAVRAGTFSIHAIEDVDQAMELLTGVDAGVPDEDGSVPEGSVNYLVSAQLLMLSEMRRAFGAHPQDKAPDGKRKAAAKKQKPPSKPLPKRKSPPKPGKSGAGPKHKQAQPASGRKET
ncbi:MAG TPA: ATP-binding protein [Gallionellaceae bacterium]|nr:ATP-binding protein [Gallionellaceae bacterium]